jgi:hypothetical protein
VEPIIIVNRGTTVLPLTPYLFGNLIVSHLVKKFPASMESADNINVFKQAHYYPEDGGTGYKDYSNSRGLKIIVIAGVSRL